MATVKVAPGQLGAILRAQAKGMPDAVRAGLSIAAQRGRTHLTSKSPVYTGVLKNAWEAKSHLGGGNVVATVENSAPYAGIIERGARPHWTSPEGIEALRRWVQLKIPVATIARGKRAGKRRTATAAEARPGGKHAAEIDRIVHAIVAHWAKVGRKGKFTVRDALPLLGRWASQEVAEQLRRFIGGGTP